MAITMDATTTNVSSAVSMREAATINEGDAKSPLVTVKDGFERTDNALREGHKTINSGDKILSEADKTVEPQLARGLTALGLALLRLPTKILGHAGIATARTANNGAEAVVKSGAAIAEGASYIVSDGNPAEVR